MPRSLFPSIFLLFTCLHLSAQDFCGADKFFGNTKISHQHSTSGIARTAGTVYTIPVVVHVMHPGDQPGTGVNLSDTEIMNAIMALNQRYRKVAGSIGDGSSVDMQLQFSLAVRDPNGDCTNAINRVDMTSYQSYVDNGIGTQGMDDTTLKSLSFWDSHFYCNIWIVNSIEGLSGYSNYAGGHGQSYDGIVINSEAVRDYMNNVTLTHEMGHYLDLFHTFEGDDDGNSCPANNDCAVDGDMVCDTDPHIRFTTCELDVNGCTLGDNHTYANNYMSYTCHSEFTQGQKARVQNTVTTIRASLLEENGNVALTPPSGPSGDFVAVKNVTCVGSQIQLLDRTLCVPNTQIRSTGWTGISHRWKVENNTGVSLAFGDQNPSFILQTAGSYDVTLEVTTPGGTNTVTKQNFLVVGDAPTVTSCAIVSAGAADPNRADDVGIREFRLGDLHHVSGTSTEDASNGVTDNNGYGDFSCLEVATLTPFTEYTIEVLLSEFEPEMVNVYIDFDNNGITAEDLVTSNDNVPAGSGVFSLPPFTTPAFPVFNTRLRMRVVDASLNNGPVLDACGEIGYYGQIHDFSIVFLNTPPVAVDDVVTINEDNVATINAISNDIDDGTIDPQTISLDPNVPFLRSKTTTDGKWVADAAGVVKFTPIADFNGPAKITYTVNDNSFVKSAPGTITVNVMPVNDPPSFVKGADQVVDENSGGKTITGWAAAMSPGPNDESGQALMFGVTNDNNSLFTVQPSIDGLGALSYTVADQKHGVANVSVILKDDGGTSDGGVNASDTQVFKITVNDLPDAPITGLEDETTTIVVYPNPSSGKFTLKVSGGWSGSKVDVLDAYGRIVYESIIERELLIEMPERCKGVFVLRVGGREVCVKRILIN